MIYSQVHALKQIYLTGRLSENKSVPYYANIVYKLNIDHLMTLQKVHVLGKSCKMYHVIKTKQKTEY